MSLVSPTLDLEALRVALRADVVLVLVPGITPGSLLVLDRAGNTDGVPTDVVAQPGSLLARVLEGIEPGRVECFGLVGAAGECVLGPTLLLPVRHPDLGDAVLVLSRASRTAPFDDADLARARRFTAAAEPAIELDALGGDATFRMAFEAATVGMSLVDASLRYRWVNAPQCDMLGRTQRELLSLLVTDTVHPDHVDRAATFFDRLRRGEVGGVRDRLRLLRPDDRPLWAEIGGSVVWGAVPEPLLLVQQFDVTAEQEVADDFAYRAMHDELTGVANRALLREKLSAVLARAHRGGVRGVVFFLDVDDFKQINDLYGHKAGDRVLVETARRLSAVVRAGDTVARVGGDEFVVAGEATGSEEATHMAERIGAALTPTVDLDGRRLPVEVSIGVALNGVLDSPEDLIERADRALLKAKRLTRLHVVSTETA
jgi:diguanylate cyclase (GGDEF)-like protein/PAS domain S-box-containing protein